MGKWRNARTDEGVQPQQLGLLLGRPRRLGDGGVEVVLPALAALLPDAPLYE